MNARFSNTSPRSGPRPGASTRSSWSGSTCGSRSSTGTRLVRAEASARPRMSSRGPFPLTSCVMLVIKTRALSSEHGTTRHRGNSSSWGGKAQALKIVLGLMPADVFTNVLLPAVSELGWETCPWSDDSFPTSASSRVPHRVQATLLGERAWRCRRIQWVSCSSARLTSTRSSC